jgi:splicing factor 3B subunit 5
MADKLRQQQQLEQLQSRYVGTGHADTTSFEYKSNVARDTYSSIIAHPALLQYTALGLGEPMRKVRTQMIDRMVFPVGPPPEVEEEGTVNGSAGKAKRQMKVNAEGLVEDAHGK